MNQTSGGESGSGSSASHRRTGVARKLVGGAATVGALTLIVKLVATLKELAVANAFGTADVVDAFLIAFLLPTLAINVAAGSISGAFIPVYIDAKERRGAAAANELFASVELLSILVLGAVAVLLTLIMPLALRFVASAFGPDKVYLTQSLYLSLLPVVVLSGIVATWTSLLNAEEQFVPAAIVPLAVPAVTLFAIILTTRWIGIYSLALGTVLGTALQAVLLATALKARKVEMRFRWVGMTTDLRRVANQYVLLAIAAFFVSGTILVDQAMAATLSSGSVAALNYGIKVVAVGLEIGAFALGVVALPYFSRLVVKQDWNSVRRMVQRYALVTLIVAIPAAAVLAFASETLVELLFHRGAFTPGDVVLVGRIQAFYMLQVPFVLAGMLFVRLISALQQNRILLTGAMITFLANIGLNFLFMNWLGVAGIALATSVVFLISFVYLSLRVRLLVQPAVVGS